MIKFAFRVIFTREYWNFSYFVGGHFENKNDSECNFHHYQSISHFKITLDINFHWNQRTLKFCRFCWRPFCNKIGKISIFSNFNENWYLGLFWSKELIGNDENCIQGNFCDATVSKMAANKIDKLLMVSDINEYWYLWNSRILKFFLFCWRPFWK
jgi:hypothetical protein